MRYPPDLFEQWGLRFEILLSVLLYYYLLEGSQMGEKKGELTPYASSDLNGGVFDAFTFTVNKGEKTC